MGLSVSGSMKRSVQESADVCSSGGCDIQNRPDLRKKPVRKSQGFCLKERNGESGFWMERKSTEKAVWQGMQKIFSKKGCCLEEEQYLEIPKDRDLRRMFYKIRLAGLALSADMLVFASAVQGAEAVGYLHDLEIKVPEEIEVIAAEKKKQHLFAAHS